MSTKT